MQRLVKEGGIYTTKAYIPSKISSCLEEVVLVFDPGCAITLIDTSFMNLIGYDAAKDGLRHSSLDGACGASQGYTVQLATFKCLEQELNNFEIACHDLNSNLGVIGLLGMNFLKHFRMDIDFRDGTIHKINKR